MDNGPFQYHTFSIEGCSYCYSGLIKSPACSTCAHLRHTFPAISINAALNKHFKQVCHILFVATDEFITMLADDINGGSSSKPCMTWGVGELLHLHALMEERSRERERGGRGRERRTCSHRVRAVLTTRRPRPFQAERSNEATRNKNMATSQEPYHHCYNCN